MSVARVGTDEARPTNAFFLMLNRANQDHVVVEAGVPSCCSVVQVLLHGGSRNILPVLTELVMTTNILRNSAIHRKSLLVKIHLSRSIRQSGTPPKNGFLHFVVLCGVCKLAH